MTFKFLGQDQPIGAWFACQSCGESFFDARMYDGTAPMSFCPFCGQKEEEATAAAFNEVNNLVLKAEYRNTLCDVVAVFGGDVGKFSSEAQDKIRQMVGLGPDQASTAAGNPRWVAAWEALNKK